MLLLDSAAGTQPDTADLAWQRDDPTPHRAQVHQATGMMLVQLGVGADAAFARLRAYAYAHDRCLGDVAATSSSGGYASSPIRHWRATMSIDAVRSQRPTTRAHPLALASRTIMR
jgi:hypothetical protein